MFRTGMKTPPQEAGFFSGRKKEGRGGMQSLCPLIGGACGPVRRGGYTLKKTFLIKALLTAAVLCLAVPTVKVRASEPVVVVIDPGHGGENRGGEVPGQFLEKELTLQTALAMKQTLEQFEGVQVYLTRTADQELSLEERAQIAKAFQADFLFSLHYNMSASHEFYGSEIWTSAFGSYYSAGQTFGRLQLAEMAGLGQYSRGVKTRLSSRGTDYYGVIRAARELDIPCVIIEHCHMDHPVDSHQIDTAQEVANMGVSDAIAVAKYFHLKSPSLGLDYTNYAYETVPAPSGAAGPDSTPPSNVNLTLLSADPSTGKVDLRLEAQDAESGVLYYSCSLDGGVSWSTLMPYASLGTLDFSVTVPKGSQPVILCRAYNGYDKYTESAAVAPGIFSAE